MFTGIITEIGEVVKIEKRPSQTTFTIKTKTILKGKKIGQSIAVNGVCLTITKIQKSNFSFDAISETLKRSNLKSLKLKDKVNLESALRLNQGLDGHFVQGHVDTEGTVKAAPSKNNDFTLTVSFPPEIAQYLAFKGAITINGVSLTISNLQEDNFSVKLIPHTLKTTNLNILKIGDKVNLEIDLIARHIKRLLDNKANQVNYEFLKERNLI